MSFPVDVPWKRLCVSGDMIDTRVCDHKFPNRWKSSITVFSYQPSEEYQTIERMTVSFLKVTCTITGFQEDPDELGLKDGRTLQHWKDARVVDVYLDIAKEYYPCHGAILEVSIKPSKTGLPLSQYPYFTDFEPKKRELYELVSETGEKMSRSLEDVNVQKGNTTSQSNEVMDIEGGFSQKVAIGGVDITGSNQG